MKKILVIVAVLIFSLAACAPAADVSDTKAVTAPDASLATPVAGFATVRSLQGMEALLLHSQPVSESPLAGQVAPGENGKLLGVNDAGTWVLVQFTDQSGWAPVEALDLTIAQ